ncbi:SMF1 [Candida theae]|uniref:SMF1 n=1 Tax=Candida theae TaxID=1198502 RepID=A0AAD5BGI8_9ASCO|nr:SMF1 [Candida theae]KAI5960896.1 SMF1 [Candida theae]
MTNSVDLANEIHAASPDTQATIQEKQTSTEIIQRADHEDSFSIHERNKSTHNNDRETFSVNSNTPTPLTPPPQKRITEITTKTKTILRKYASFIGPGLVVSVSFIDPGNYQTCVTGGSSNQFSLLFIVFLSNCIAIFLQSLCIKLGSVTGYDLARCSREFLPRKLNLLLWVLAEAAIIATDIAEVIGSAIALNILLRIPLPAGVVITIVDVLFVLMAYRADTSSMKFVKIFEYSVGALVGVVVVCFCIQLSKIHADARDIFRGYVPSKQMFEGSGLTIATSIVGATVMIHSLFLGSGLVQPRLREYDVKNGYVNLDKLVNDDNKNSRDEKSVTSLASTSSCSDEEKKELKRKQYEKEADFFYHNYKPSYKAINYSLKYSIIELALSLCTLALFVNSAIMIVAGATMYGTPEAMDADLYTIHDLLSRSIAPAMGTIFMVALLFSGQSAGIVCTIAGQVVSEGHINWTLKPWLRRLITRCISIIPCLVVSVCLKREGMSIALNISQVIISILLPPLTAPLIYFTCSKKFMRVKLSNDDEYQLGAGKDVFVDENGNRYKYMTNNWITTICAVAVWILVSMLNIYAIYDMAKNGVAG